MLSRLAHLVRWQFVDGSIGDATKTPFRQEFLDRIATLKNRKLARWEASRSVTIYRPGVRDVVQKAIIDIFGAETCALCLTGGPCWYWTRDYTDFVTYSGEGVSWAGKLDGTRRESPADVQTIRDLYSDALSRTTLLSSQDALERALPGFGIRMGQLRQGLVANRPVDNLNFISAVLDESLELNERQMREQMFPPQPPGRLPRIGAPVVAPRPAAPVPAPVQTPPIPSQPPPTPPDPDEVYAKCEHDFEQSTRICKKCNLPSRSRFSWLEID